MPEIIEKGYLYIATPPLYKVTEGTGKKETFKYFFDDKALEAYKAKAKGTYHVSYLKGLGEMQPQQLWDSTLDPAKRRMIQVTCDDSASCCKAIEICMGNDVEIRKNFILENVNFEEVHE